MESALQQALSKVGHFLFDQPILSPIPGKKDVTLPGMISNVFKSAPMFSRPAKGAKPTPTPKPGYKYVSGTNIQAPLDSEWHPENKAKIKVKPSTDTKIKVKQPTPTPTIAAMAKAVNDIARGRSPINMATLSPTAKQTLPDLDQAIEQATKRFPVNKDLLYDIAFAESSWNPKTVNEIGATGYYQFTPGTWEDVLGYHRDPNSSLYGLLPSEQATDPYANALAAAYLINMGQLGKWDASEWNWGQYYDLGKEIEEPGYYKQSLYHIPGTRASIRLGGE